jgi:hypothetical protein
LCAPLFKNWWPGFGSNHTWLKRIKRNNLLTNIGSIDDS